MSTRENTRLTSSYDRHLATAGAVAQTHAMVAFGLPLGVAITLACYGGGVVLLPSGCDLHPGAGLWS